MGTRPVAIAHRTAEPVSRPGQMPVFPLADILRKRETLCAVFSSGRNRVEAEPGGEGGIERSSATARAKVREILCAETLA